MEKKIKSIILTVDVAQKLLNYLVTKPYAESADLITAIQKSEQIFESEPELTHEK